MNTAKQRAITSFNPDDFIIRTCQKIRPGEYVGTVTANAHKWDFYHHVMPSLSVVTIAWRIDETGKAEVGVFKKGRLTAEEVVEALWI